MKRLILYFSLIIIVIILVIGEIIVISFISGPEDEQSVVTPTAQPSASMQPSEIIQPPEMAPPPEPSVGEAQSGFSPPTE